MTRYILKPRLKRSAMRKASKAMYARLGIHSTFATQLLWQACEEYFKKFGRDADPPYYMPYKGPRIFSDPRQVVPIPYHNIVLVNKTGPGPASGTGLGADVSTGADDTTATGSLDATFDSSTDPSLSPNKYASTSSFNDVSSSSIEISSSSNDVSSSSNDASASSNDVSSSSTADDSSKFSSDCDSIPRYIPAGFASARCIFINESSSPSPSSRNDSSADFGAGIQCSADSKTDSSSSELFSCAAIDLNDSLTMASRNVFVRMNNGKRIPILGLGTFESEPGQVTEAVKVALDCGYRHIDCAHVYGNESEVGIALTEKFKNNFVKREDVFITSKLWCTHHHPDDVEDACRQTLTNLQLDYLDLYLIHWPMAYKRGSELLPTDKDGNCIAEDIDYVDTYLAMEKLVSSGLCKAIGVSNFTTKMIKRIMDKASIKPANNQVELHPLLTQEKLVRYCKDNDIMVTAYSPLGSSGRPWMKADDPKLMEDPIVKEIAEKKGKHPAQVLIRFSLDRGIICIPKSVTPARIRANFEALNFELNSEEMKRLMDMNRNYRGFMLEWVDHRDHPFKGSEKDDD